MNITNNETVTMSPVVNTPTTQNNHTTQDVILVVIFFTIFCFGTIGNSLVIYVFGYTIKKPRSKQERLILLLGIVDLIASVTNPFLFIYLTLKQYKAWDFGAVGCKILPMIGPVATNLSAGILLIMAIYRDRSIVSPFKYPFKISTIYIAVVAALILSILAYFYYAWYLTIKNGACMVISTNLGYKIPKVTMLISSDLLFFVIFTVTSFRIFTKIKTTQKELEALGNNSRQKSIERSKSAIRLIVAMEITFMLCCYPQDFLHLVHTFSYLIPPTLPYTYTIRYLNAVLKVLHTANSCINVLLYSAMNRKFRCEIFRLFRCCGLFKNISGKESTYAFRSTRKSKLAVISNFGSLVNGRHPTVSKLTCTDEIITKNNAVWSLETSDKNLAMGKKIIDAVSNVEKVPKKSVSYSQDT